MSGQQDQLPSDYIDFMINFLKGHCTISFRCGKCGEIVGVGGLCINSQVGLCFLYNNIVGYDDNYYVCPTCNLATDKGVVI